MKTIAWKEINDYLSALEGSQLVGVVTKLADKFGLSEGMANDYVLFYMGYK